MKKELLDALRARYEAQVAAIFKKGKEAIRRNEKGTDRSTRKKV